MGVLSNVVSVSAVPDSLGGWVLGIGSSLKDMAVLGWLNSFTFTAILSKLLSNVVDSDTVVVESSDCLGVDMSL